MQNLEMHFSCWAQYIDSIKNCLYPTVNSQILIFYDTCRLLISICRALGPMTQRTVDISDQWSFRLLTITSTPEYWPFIVHYRNAKLFGKYSQIPVWHLCDSCQILGLFNLKNNLTLPNSKIAKLQNPDSMLRYSEITHRYAKKTPHSVVSCTDKSPLIHISSILFVNVTSPVS